MQNHKFIFQDFLFQQKKLLQQLFVLAIVFFVISGCTSDKPQAINYGHDSCNHCRMIITDKRFGGELVTKKGKSYKFDSLECLNKYMILHPDDYKIYAVDSAHDGNFIEIEKAYFELRSDLRSPMGLGVLAFPSRENVTKGSLIQWKDLQSKLLK